MSFLFNRAVIAGVGLIGGSLGLAGKQRGVFKTVAGFGRNENTLKKALELGLIDEAHTELEKACAGADLFFAATPVESIVSLCVNAGAHLPESCVMTDGGSVKGRIVEDMERLLPNPGRFVGGHPIAGTEKSGPSAAFSTLFDNRYTILTPTQATDTRALSAAREMWEKVGSIVVEMTPEEHDAALAMISHLPHIAAFALVDALNAADPDKTIRRYVAGGFKDTTRIAASHPAMWRDIFSMNRRQVLNAVEAFEKSLGELKYMISEGRFEDLERTLESISVNRKEMENSGNSAK
ncbi:MAG: prephenate dehydrogenase/arogenate dehydrogenase family protein [Nitrospinae bacterium]|nr:prephenate dehydrogenase/arogenate dehydrogenase family protein [Nitrospinota bacterium]